LSIPQKGSNLNEGVPFYSKSDLSIIFLQNITLSDVLDRFVLVFASDKSGGDFVSSLILDQNGFYFLGA